MGPPPSVVPGVPGHDQPQVPLTEDQHPAADLDPRGEQYLSAQAFARGR
jgi:hypothetical protein